MEINKFNLRVYGLLIREGKLLVTDENRGGLEMTKLPGGGLEFGEGTVECLKREFVEEMNIEITVRELFFTNDFLQISKFRKSDQLHSFYYFVKTTADLSNYKEENYQPVKPGEQRFRWVDLMSVKVDDFTFPIDKVVVRKLIG